MMSTKLVWTRLWLDLNGIDLTFEKEKKKIENDNFDQSSEQIDGLGQCDVKCVTQAERAAMAGSWDGPTCPLQSLMIQQFGQVDRAGASGPQRRHQQHGHMEAQHCGPCNLKTHKSNC